MGSSSFTHYAETEPLINDGNRRLEVSLGEVGGLDLTYVGAGVDGKHVDLVLTLEENRKLVRQLRSCDPEHFDRSSGYYLYHVVITRYPEGSWTPVEIDGEEIDSYPTPGWRPEGWNPDDEWLERFGKDFFWPSTRREYKSLSSAKSRAKLIEHYGATAQVVRSSLITWPEV